MEAEDDLNECSPMWDGSEKWYLEAYNNQGADIFVVFVGPNPTVQELAALRRVSDVFRDVPVAQLKAELMGKGEVPLGRFINTVYRPRARQAEERVRKNAPTLQLRVESFSYLSYVPIGEGENGQLIAYQIEDEDLYKRVVAKMIEHNVPVELWDGRLR